MGICSQLGLDLECSSPNYVLRIQLSVWDTINRCQKLCKWNLWEGSQVIKHVSSKGFFGLQTHPVSLFDSLLPWWVAPPPGALSSMDYTAIGPTHRS